MIFFLSSGYVFGQTESKVNLNHDSEKLELSGLVQKRDNQTESFSKKNINLSISQSLNTLFIKNNGFKKETDYFKSGENVFVNEFGKVKLNTSASRDLMESYLNMILNK
ncbi:hypothetical protein [Chryseobacterium sp.]|uniref:hypothetical protein n=1 Tax=Chryseobacterium sp. TaxID=1871047 RepID=UPI0028A1E2D3|nr:hypothetical protein [Chryseobacterium sp.]